MSIDNYNSSPDVEVSFRLTNKGHGYFNQCLIKAGYELNIKPDDPATISRWVFEYFFYPVIDNYTSSQYIKDNTIAINDSQISIRKLRPSIRARLSNNFSACLIA